MNKFQAAVTVFQPTDPPPQSILARAAWEAQGTVVSKGPPILEMSALHLDLITILLLQVNYDAPIHFFHIVLFT